MKRISSIALTLIGICLLFSISSCKKVWDQIKQHPDGAADNCRIERIAFLWKDIPEYPPYIDTAVVSYNSNGDPINVIYTSGEQIVIGYPNKFFKYDSQHRLSAYFEDVTSYLTGWGKAWHKYVYIGSNTIIDSTFDLVDAEGFLDADRPERTYPYGEPPVAVVSKYTLDNYGRIIQSELRGNITTYTYDANGNLVKPGVTYTNKTNIRQTHKTWMFISKDYSVNAPAGEAYQYNSNKLPVAAKNSMFLTFNFDPEANLDQLIRISYICK